jgi:hypothetical protein
MARRSAITMIRCRLVTLGGFGAQPGEVVGLPPTIGTAVMFGTS